MVTVTYGEERTELEKKIDASVLERVQRGLAWLEEHHGPGWEDKIDMSIFDLGDLNNCVLGQVYADKADAEHQTGYEYAYKLVPGPPATPGLNAADHGFAFTLHDFPNDGKTVLQETWEHVLAPRVKDRVA